MTTTRREYPRKQFERQDWVNLNGEWEFEFDDHQIGIDRCWFADKSLSLRIQVPFCYQSKLSGIGDTSFHDTVWYRRQVDVTEEQLVDRRVKLHFGAVDYEAWVWVNGQFVCYHEGGHTPFSMDITNELRVGSNHLVVKAQDYSTDVALPRGKQYWKEKSEGIFYTGTTGIWQSVWMESVSQTYLEKVRMTPDLDEGMIYMHYFVDGIQQSSDIRLETEISYKGKPIAIDRCKIFKADTLRGFRLDQHGEMSAIYAWTPEHPHLYDVQFSLYVNGTLMDMVKSYFGMRKVSIKDGRICLNNYPYFTKMVLDQGYYPDGVMTAPSDDDLRRDVELIKEMGFNGARKHQKIEDPNYLYWCDKLGVIVWGEMANAYVYSESYVKRFNKEWMEAIERDYNHPCIMAWVPLNESWGVPEIKVSKQQQDHAHSLYYLTKSLDQTRLVISNDGWEHVKTDIATIHDYEWRNEVLKERYQTNESSLSARPANRSIILPEYEDLHSDVPVHISEFGGIAFKKSSQEGWGYSGADNETDFIERLAAVVLPMFESKAVQGYCYTQFTDVEQEINGLLTYDRQPKVNLAWINEINHGRIPDRKG